MRRAYAVYKLCALTTHCTGRVPAARAGELNTLSRRLTRAGGTLDPKQHWEHIYTTKHATEVSWFQTDPHVSLDFIRRVAPDVHTTIADVGGGASTLVDGLLLAGYRNLTVLDISDA